MEEIVSTETSCDVIKSDSCHVISVRDCEVSNDVTNDNVALDSPIASKIIIQDDDRLSICSTQSEDEATMGVEERPSSSMSCSSAKGSRIPRLCRSSSVRNKNKSYNEDHCGRDSRDHNKPSPPFSGLQRSQSFATSRGMAGLMSSGNMFRNKVPLTPEIKRKKTPLYNPSYVSPYSMKVIASERKTQSYAGMSHSSTSYSLAGYHPHHLLFPCRRLSLPPVPPMNSCTGSELSEVDNEDNISERSFSSTNSLHGCCDRGNIRSGLWGGHRPKNILHCSHAHDQHDPDDYLTPTQRAARKIRELTAELKKTRREITEKDSKISVLTRDLVELRIDKAERRHSLEEEESKCKKSKYRSKVLQFASNSEQVAKLAIRSYSPAGDAACVSPPSDGSEAELRMLKRSAEDGSSVEKITEAPSSPADSDSGDHCRSLADSGHYDDQDLPSPCLSPRVSMDNIGRSSTRKLRGSFCSENDESDQRLWSAVNAADESVQTEFDRRIESMKENHMEEYQELKERHNDRVEMLLSKLSDSNLKYFEIRPLYDKSLEKIRELEKTNEKLKQELHESELRQQKIYLQMYLKGQQAAQLEAEGKICSRRSSESEMEKAASEASKTDQESILNDTIVISLMRQLTHAEKEIDKLKTLYNEEVNRTNRSRSNSTFGLRREEIDPAITLQFLKSAIYYFLTDRENAQGHLRAIESILGYTSMERGQISKYVKI